MAKENNLKSNNLEKRTPTVFEAVSAVLLLIACFTIGTILSLNYVPIMVLVAGYSAIISKRCGYTWKEMEMAVGERVRKAMPVMTVLVAVGALVGGLIFSGTLPMLIYYGLQFVSPRWVALSAFLLCCFFSIVTGTSNGSASTAGLAMMGLAMSMENVNLGLVAGACYAGVIFGDKLSPISDTTVMAALVTDNDLFDHIKHMSKTVIPAAIISVVIYVIYGITSPSTGNVISQSTMDMLRALESMFKWSPLLLLPVVFILWGAFTKKPPNILLFSAAFMSVAIGVLYQGFSLSDGMECLYSGFKTKMILSANPSLDLGNISSAATSLLNRGGISSMMKSFITCFLCMYFAGISEQCGVLTVLLDKLLGFVKSQGSLVTVSGLSVMLLCAIGGSSTVGLLIGGELFKEKYEKMGLHSLNLSRTLEDFGTGATGFFPWTYSGMLYVNVLSATNLTFLRYSYMSWFIWILAIVYGFTGICMKKLDIAGEKVPVGGETAANTAKA